MSNRFHNKWHRSSHHTYKNPDIIDSGWDPIASQDAPFRGDFVMQPGLPSADPGDPDEKWYMEAKNIKTADLYPYDEDTNGVSVHGQTGENSVKIEPASGEETKNKIVTTVGEETHTLVLPNVDGELVTSTDFVFVRGSGTDSGKQIQTVVNPIVNGQNNTALSQGSLVEGASNYAGLKGYRYTNAVGTTITNNLTFETVPAGWAVDDVVSVINGSKYPDAGTIQSIAADQNTGKFVVTFKANLDVGGTVKDDDGWDARCAYVSAKPDKGNVDLGYGAHADGVGSKAMNVAAHAEGRETKALGQYSHSEGRGTEAQYCAHAEGNGSKALGQSSHAEGIKTEAKNNYEHAEGCLNASHTGPLDKDRTRHSIGIGPDAEHRKNAVEIMVSGDAYLLNVGGYDGTNPGSSSSVQTVIKGITDWFAGGSLAAGTDSSTGYRGVALGYKASTGENNTGNTGAVAIGNQAKALADGACQIGWSSAANTAANTLKFHDTTIVDGNGKIVSASLDKAFVDKTGDTMTGGLTVPNLTVGSRKSGSHVGIHSTAEGTATTASDANSHAEGATTTASGSNSHAEGSNTLAGGKNSHAEGSNTITQNISEHAQGQYNVSHTGDTDAENTIHSIGIGTDDSRANAVEVMRDGKVFIKGIGSYTGQNNPSDASVSDLATVVNGKIGPIISKTWAELKAMRDANNGAGSLVSGHWYRITDYVATTSQADTQSANHPFDIIVMADATNKFNENAHAIQHAGDTYFNGCKLEAWKIKYCLDNDTNRFAWADTTNGKGVVYYLKDEFDNECPYDFKGIQFKRWAVTDVTSTKLDSESVDSLKTQFVYDANNNRLCYAYKSTNISNNETVLVVDSTVSAFYFTFDNEGIDASLLASNNVYGNKIEQYIESNKLRLNSIVLLGSGCYSNTFGGGCYSNTFGGYCYFNTFGVGCYSNTFGGYCYSNTFGGVCSSNTFGGGCYSNTFGGGCSSNTFGGECTDNTFDSGCSSNTFGGECTDNTFDSGCTSNAFGSYCSSNTFGSDCSNNTFDGGCDSNSFGSGCSSNTFGIYCSSNTFGVGCSSNTFGNVTGFVRFSSTRSLNVGSHAYYNGLIYVVAMRYRGSFSKYVQYSVNERLFYNDTYYKCTVQHRGGWDASHFQEVQLVGGILADDGSVIQSYFRNIVFENGVQYVALYCSSSRSDSEYYQNVTVTSGVKGTGADSNQKLISDGNKDQSFKTTYQPADSRVISV